MMLVQKKQYPQRCCRLGEASPLEQELVQRGLLQKAADHWELTTRETPGKGEAVRPGDYVKLDSVSMPYPNDPVFFQENHTHLEGEWYLQKARPVHAWTLEQGEDPRIDFLIRTGRLTITPEDPQKTFSAFLWGTQQSAARDGVLILSRVDYTAGGEIADIAFHMVAGEEFYKTYDILEASV